jgi:hypothetical protein
MKQLMQAGLLNAVEASVLSRLRRHNALLFDFVLKRTLNHGSLRLAPTVFESAKVLQS